MNIELFSVLSSLEEEMLASNKRGEWARIFEALSSRYRSEKGPFLRTYEEKMVYLFTRMPATFSAVLRVFYELQARDRTLFPQTILDVGAGPGTGMWAAHVVFPDIEQFFLLERDEQFMNLGKIIASRASSHAIRSSHWSLQNMTGLKDLSGHDLVLLSYSIGELEEGSWFSILSELWKATKKAIVIIEPGTPNGYERILKMRNILLSLGGYIWAPCPHAQTCPLIKPDWCHFSARVQRSSLHRQLKSGDLGYEDEKFSYLIVGKYPCNSYERIIRPPIQHSGHVRVTLCTKEGIQNKIFSKKNKDLYKAIKKCELGDIIPFLDNY